MNEKRLGLAQGKEGKRGGFNTHTRVKLLAGKQKHTMLHLPSALVGSLTAGGGFLLIHRELSHRNRLSNKWLLREYAEAQWKDFRSDRRIEDSKVSSEWVQAGLLARPPD